MSVRGGQHHRPARPAGARGPGQAARPARGAPALGRRPGRGGHRHRRRRRGGRRRAGHLADQLGQGGAQAVVGPGRHHPGGPNLPPAGVSSVRQPGRQLELRAGPERLAGGGQGRPQPGAAGTDLGVERLGAGPRAGAEPGRPDPARGRRQGHQGPTVRGLGLGALQRLRPADHPVAGRRRRQGGLEEDRGHPARPGVAADHRRPHRGQRRPAAAGDRRRRRPGRRDRAGRRGRRPPGIADEEPEIMVRAGKEDPELNLLVGRPDPRVRRRGFLRVAGFLAAAGVAGYAGGTVAGWGDDSTGGAAAAADGQPVSGNRVNERLLNIYNWSDYIDDRTIPLFQALTNLRVNYDVYSSNEDLLARMKSGPTEYDIIVPTNNFIPTYMKLDLIEPLRQDLMPNLTNLDKEFVETDYDPGNRYTVPWQWGTTGIGFNRKRAGDEVDSWAAVFEPSSAMGGHVTLLREVTDLIGCALIYLGRSPNSIDDADLADVVKLVRSIKPKLKGFTTDTYIDELAASETWLAQGWSGDVFQAQDQNQDVSYAIPKEGSLRFVDVMAVPKGAPHPANAARFMNYVLHPRCRPGSPSTSATAPRCRWPSRC